MRYDLLVANIVVAIFFWLCFVVPAALVSLPIVLLGRRRVRWHRWELLAFVVPFCVWFLLQYFVPAPPRAKDLNNLILEPFFIAAAVPLVAAIRAVAGKGLEADERVFAVVLQAVPCALAAVVHFFTPNLGGGFHHI